MKKAFIVFLFVGSLAIIACDNPVSSNSGSESSGPVPSWARGTWYVSSGNVKIKVAEITSTQYIAFQVSGYNSSYNITVTELIRFDYSSINGDTINFSGWQVKKSDSSNQIIVGQQGQWQTLHK